MGLTHVYQQNNLPAQQVLDIPEWQVLPGNQVLLRGKSGSGKTTLLNILAGLLTPTTGQVTVNGQDLARLSEAQRDRFRATHIGYVFQTHNLLPFSAIENVEMPLAFLGESRHQRQDRARQALAEVGLEHFERHHPHQLSAGQRLRIAVARALVARPALLLADEPTAALDPETGLRVVDLLQDTCRDAGATLIVSSHDLSLAERFVRLVDLSGMHLIETIKQMEANPV